MLRLTNPRPCMVALFSGLMTGHRPTSCAPQSLDSHISSADPEGSVLGTYGTVSTVKVLPDGQTSAPFRFLTFPSIRAFLSAFPHKYSMQHMRPHSKCTNMVSIFVSGWGVYMLISLNRNERYLEGKRPGMCQTLHKSAREVLSLNTCNN